MHFRGMFSQDVRATLQRELRALRREIERYPDEASLWDVPPGVKNSTGTLALHLAGNLQHYLGARLAGTTYLRNRDAEFSRRNVTRAEILDELSAAATAIDAAFDHLPERALGETYPEQVAGVTCTTGEFLVHLAVHLGYHLGQIDYHRRIVTGDATTVDTVSVKELRSATAG
jgi:hypothetical protein